MNYRADSGDVVKDYHKTPGAAGYARNQILQPLVY